MTYCDERWRKFKTNLANNYVHIEVPEGRPRPNPCEQYSFIDEVTWQEFRRLRTTPEALERRRKAQESGRKNDCPHTMSRGGYAKAEKDLLAAKRKRLEEAAQSDPSVLLSPPSPIRREEKWKFAHQKRSGDYTSEQSRIVGEKIEELQKKQSKGSFRSDGRNDILTVATRKEVHPGRVKGVGGGVSIRDYFGAPPRRSSSSMVTREEMERILATVRAEARAEAEASLDARFEERFSKMKEEWILMTSTRQADTSADPQAHSLNPKQSTKGSCIGQSSEGPGKEIGDPCDLFVEDPLRRLVARGSVHNLGSTVHHKEIKDDQVRVAVEEVIEADAPLPIPVADFKVVGDVLNSFILWPKNLVSDRAEESPPPPSPPPPPPPSTQDVSRPPLNIMQQVILMAYDMSFATRDWSTESAVGKSGAQCFLERDDLMSLVAPLQ